MKFAIWLPAFFLVLLTVLASAEEHPQSAHGFVFTSIDEEEQIELASLAGKAVLVINTASFCGFTHQYSGLQELWREYRDRGLVVIGVPSNDFGAQEPHSEAKIQKFIEDNFLVEFDEDLTRTSDLFREGVLDSFGYVDLVGFLQHHALQAQAN